MNTPTLVYDDDCGFCTWCARRIGEQSDVTLCGFSELDAATRERLPENYEQCAHLVTADAVYSCGESIEEAILQSEVGADLRPVVDLFRQFENYGTLRERAYRVVADRRDLFGKVVSSDPPAR